MNSRPETYAGVRALIERPRRSDVCMCTLLTFGWLWLACVTASVNTTGCPECVCMCAICRWADQNEHAHIHTHIRMKLTKCLCSRHKQAHNRRVQKHTTQVGIEVGNLYFALFVPNSPGMREVAAAALQAKTIRTHIASRLAGWLVHTQTSTFAYR